MVWVSGRASTGNVAMLCWRDVLLTSGAAPPPPLTAPPALTGDGMRSTGAPEALRGARRSRRHRPAKAPFAALWPRSDDALLRPRKVLVCG